MVGLIRAADVTGAEWPGVVAAADLAVVPVGAVEWHGPHLPLGADLLLAEGFAADLDDGDDDGATDGQSDGRELRGVLYPAVAYSAVPGQTRGWPGTVAIRPEVALGYLCDVLDSVVAAGFTRVLVVNGHDANMSVVRSAMEWVSGRRRASLMLANWFQMVTPAETTEIFGDLVSRGHGGAYETAGVLGFRPEAVDLGAVEDLPPRARLDTPSPYVLIESHPTPWAGWSGHVSAATPTRGSRVRELAGARLRDLVRTWVAAPLPEAPRGAEPDRDER